MSPLPPGALQQLLKTLPPEKPDPYPHLEWLNPDQLLQRRIEVSAQIKSLEQERQAIDAELMGIFSDRELRSGIHAPGGWVLRQRSRTNWDYPREIKEAVQTLQQQAKRDGSAKKTETTYLCVNKEAA